jgi:hypothetical protein
MTRLFHGFWVPVSRRAWGTAPKIGAEFFVLRLTFAARAPIFMPRGVGDATGARVVRLGRGWTKCHYLLSFQPLTATIQPLLSAIRRLFVAIRNIWIAP